MIIVQMIPYWSTADRRVPRKGYKDLKSSISGVKLGYQRRYFLIIYSDPSREFYPGEMGKN
jgi:hypothetical protein